MNEVVFWTWDIPITNMLVEGSANLDIPI